MKYQGAYLASFSSQIQYALSQFGQNPFVSDRKYQNIVLCGLGGSGIAGRLVSGYVSKHFLLPITVVSDYDLPGFVSKDTLVICSSYSGNTEETISCFNQALERESSIIVLSGGGKLSELAKENELPFYAAELGYQPRMALGYPLTYLLLIIDSLNSSKKFTPELNILKETLKDVDKFKSKALELFNLYKPLAGKPVEIIADQALYATAIRFQQQLNENPKVSAFLHPMPEMCHNVIESFVSKTDHHYFFLDSGTNSRNSHRMAFNKNILDELGNSTQLIKQPIDNLSDLIELNYVFDWFSLQCADYLNIVSSNIPNIVALKKSLLQL